MTFEPNIFLELDRIRWRHLPVDGEFLSLELAADGRLFLGGVEAFGVMVEGPRGDLIYESWLPRLEGRPLKSRETVTLIPTDEGIALQTETALYRQRDEVYEAMEVEEGQYLSLMASVEGRILGNISLSGLSEAGEDGFNLLPGGELFAEKPVSFFPIPPARRWSRPTNSAFVYMTWSPDKPKCLRRRYKKT